MSRPPSPSSNGATGAAAPTHESIPAAALAPGPVQGHEAQTTLTVSASPSPVPPTPPPKDPAYAFSPNHDHDRPHPEDEQTQTQASDTTTGPVASAMAKLGVKAAPPEIMDDPAESIVIDIRGDDPDTTLRADDEDSDEEGRGGGRGRGDEQAGAADQSLPRDSDVTDMTDADITIVHPGRRSDSPDPTLYGGSGVGSTSGGAGAEVHEHPLKMALHPPSPPPWDAERDRGGDADLENGRRVLGEDDDEDDTDGEMGLGVGGRSGRRSPQRFVFQGAKAQRMHEYGNKPRSTSRPLVPHSAYYFGPPPVDSAYGTDPCGQIGVHHPREIVRIERDYTGGELPQFTPTYPLELEGRITPTQFLETINAINEILLSAHSLGHAFVDNALAFFSLQITRAVKKTHYEKEMDRLRSLIDQLNVEMYNPVGLHIKWPRSVAFLFLEIEYY